MIIQNIPDLDIRTVDLQSLIEASEVRVDLNMPKQQRMMEIVKQMGGNPYFFRSGTLAVKVSHADTDISLDERMEDYLRML
jgi:hypothetical protein